MAHVKVCCLILDVAFDFSYALETHLVHARCFLTFFNDAKFDLVNLGRTALDTLDFTLVRQSSFLLLGGQLRIFDSLLVLVADNFVVQQVFSLNDTIAKLNQHLEILHK